MTQVELLNWQKEKTLRSYFGKAKTQGLCCEFSIFLKNKNKNKNYK
jgi:hypothetical protein